MGNGRGEKEIRKIKEINIREKQGINIEDTLGERRVHQENENLV